MEANVPMKKSGRRIIVDAFGGDNAPLEVLRGAGDNQGWLGYNRLFESNIRKTSK